jgi:hypothetical protein
MYYIVYQITNLINNKIYVGAHRTDDVDDSYMGSSKILNNSIKKHGKENFSKEIISQHESEEEMYIAESNIVTEEFVSRKDTYNLKTGGFGGRLSIETKKKIGNANRGKILNDEARKKMSDSRKGRPSPFKGKSPSEETKQKMRESRKHQVFSEETKQKLSEAHLGEKNHFYGKTHSEETKQKMSETKKGQVAHNKGIPMSEEQKLKVSLAKKGKSNGPQSEETKRKIGAANRGKPNAKKGKPLSEETRKKISDAHKARRVEDHKAKHK